MFCRPWIRAGVTCVPTCGRGLAEGILHNPNPGISVIATSTCGLEASVRPGFAASRLRMFVALQGQRNALVGAATAFHHMLVPS